MELSHDPVEDTKEYKNVIDDVEKKVSLYVDELKKEDEKTYKEMGLLPPICYRAWHMKKKILLEEYGIKWRTPSEMNPSAKFD